jgi:hypothetical protein
MEMSCQYTVTFFVQISIFRSGRERKKVTPAKKLSTQKKLKCATFSSTTSPMYTEGTQLLLIRF